MKKFPRTQFDFDTNYTVRAIQLRPHPPTPSPLGGEGAKGERGNRKQKTYLHYCNYQDI